VHSVWGAFSLGCIQSGVHEVGPYASDRVRIGDDVALGGTKHDITFCAPFQ